MIKNLVVLLCVASLGACDLCMESASVITKYDWTSTHCGGAARMEIVAHGPETAVVRCICADKTDDPNPWGWGRVAAIAAAIAISAGSLLGMLLRRGPGRSTPTPG